MQCLVRAHFTFSIPSHSLYPVLCWAVGRVDPGLLPVVVEPAGETGLTVSMPRACSLLSPFEREAFCFGADCFHLCRKAFDVCFSRVTVRNHVQFLHMLRERLESHCLVSKGAVFCLWGWALPESGDPASLFYRVVVVFREPLLMPGALLVQDIMVEDLFRVPHAGALVVYHVRCSRLSLPRGGGQLLESEVFSSFADVVVKHHAYGAKLGAVLCKDLDPVVSSACCESSSV